MSKGFLTIIAIMTVLESTSAQTVDRSAPPMPGPTPVFRLNEIKHLTLSNGIRVLLYEKHGIPLVQINAIVSTGIVDDPPDKPGLATMVATMMMEGAGNRDALGLDDAIDYLGAQLSVEAGFHTMGISLNVPVGKIDSALALMADVMLRPAFPGAELDRKKKETLTALLEWRDEPGALASVLFNRLLYGNHPYGRITVGTAGSIASFTAADLKGFHTAHFGSNCATFVVAGDVTPSVLMPMLEQMFGSWKPVMVQRSVPVRTREIDSTRVYLVDKPGAAQSEIHIGRIGAARLTPDYYPLVVMNTILGGAFTSRLNHNLRETHGYTYGAESRFEFRLEPGPFLASASVQTQVTDSSLIEFMNELGRIREPVPDAELRKARQYVALSYPSSFQTVGQIATELESMVVFNLPEDFFNTYVDHILAVTGEEVNAVAHHYIDPTKLAIVVVGDLSKVRNSIAALHLGPSTVFTVDDILGKPPSIENK